MTTDIIAQAEAALDRAVWVVFSGEPNAGGSPTYVVPHDPGPLPDPFEAVPHISAAGVPALIARVRELEGERDVLTKAGIAEIASRNNRVTEYMFHWEGRALDAEATVATLQAQVEAMRGALDNINHKAFMNAGEFPRYVREQIAALTTENQNG